MTGIESLYRKEDGRVLIEIKLSSVAQLFNTFDPAPFYVRALDHEAADYIVDTVRDFPRKTEFRIVVYLPAAMLDMQEARKIPDAIVNHFRYMMMVQDRKFRQLSIYGKFTMVVGLAFLAIAMIASKIVAETFPDSSIAQLGAIALEVAGWVAMWEPVTIHLYKLWPIIQQKKVYERITNMEINVCPYPESGVPPGQGCLLFREGRLKEE
ncbi:MAG: hypothetical protein M0R30_01070 [Methanoregula sp.]|jgi:hypothetical protein|uniref:hypothetical protein n=1 Tax=Methanoregula sp. TaxID=2052170 RepID=UPI0025F50F46|nr:hypothetical protein [Methanoregula sp.]MCK9630206.1 hypothetical protein [Methanoregula sp.]